MAKISRMKPGQILYEIRRQRMGNTTASRNTLYTLRVKEVDPEGKWVIASWNNNPEKKYTQSQANKWRVRKPEPKGDLFGMKTY